MKKQNLKEKRKLVVCRILRLDESRVDALLTLLSTPHGNLLVSEDDWAIAEYRKKLHEHGKSKMIPAEEVIRGLKRQISKRRTKKSSENRTILTYWVDHLDEKRLDAIVTLLNSPDDNLYVSEDDWAIIEYRTRQVEEGKVKMIPAEKVIKSLRSQLKKGRK